MAGGRLTPREREVLREIAAGKSRKAIARSLCISIHTVDTYIQVLAGKFPGDGFPLVRLAIKAAENPDLLAE